MTARARLRLAAALALLADPMRRGLLPPAISWLAGGLLNTIEAKPAVEDHAGVRPETVRAAFIAAADRAIAAGPRWWAIYEAGRADCAIANICAALRSWKIVLLTQ